MSLLEKLDEWIHAGLLDAASADRIRAYERQRQEPKQGSRNPLLLAFSVLGAALTGLGIILILAYQWPKFNQSVQLLVALAPLALAQLVSLLVLLRNMDSRYWREGATTFHALSIGSTIALVSTVLGLPGSLPDLLLVWLLLGLPLVYIFSSSVGSLLYLAGVSWYGMSLGFGEISKQPAFLQFILLALLFPFLYRVFTSAKYENLTGLHHWLLPLTLTLLAGTLADEHEAWMFSLFMSLAGCFVLISLHSYFQEGDRFRSTGYGFLGVGGTFLLLIILTFPEFTRSLHMEPLLSTSSLLSIECLSTLALTIAALLLWHRNRGRQDWMEDAYRLTFLFALLIVLISGASIPVATILANILCLGYGLYFIRNGWQTERLFLLNTGMLMVTILIICRFFDSDIPFLLRGLAFIAIGFGFFYANYRMIQQEKQKNPIP